MANDELHLPDLTIKGFRGIEELSISRLGRVTLLTGKNSVGKTTVLDAVRAFAARGHHSDLSALLISRDEVSLGINEDGDNYTTPNWPAIFYGRTYSTNTYAVIGPAKSGGKLRIEGALLDDEQISFLESYLPDNLLKDDFEALKTVFQKKEQIIPWIIYDTAWGRPSVNRKIRDSTLRRMFRRFFDASELPVTIVCLSLGPGLMSNYDIAQFWDNVVLTDAESQAVQALRLIFGTVVDRIAVVSDDTPAYRKSGRRVLVKLKSHDHPVPLRSLGDGAARLFSVALALANSRNGFLLIDEAENGIHHSLQTDYWRMVMQSAQVNNVQVLATTHSWDCVKGFSQAAMENEEVEGVLVRLEKDKDGLYAVEYSEEKLRAAAEYEIETR